MISIKHLYGQHKKGERWSPYLCFLSLNTFFFQDSYLHQLTVKNGNHIHVHYKSIYGLIVKMGFVKSLPNCQNDDMC